jgi:hypothetical protein
MSTDFKWSTDPKTDAEISEIMSAAMAALRQAAPNLPLMAIIAFPADSEDGTYICSGANIGPEQQRLILTLALEGVQITPEKTTFN